MFWELLKLPFEAGLASLIHLGLPRSLRHPYLGLVGWLPHDQVHSASALLDQMMMEADALPHVGMVCELLVSRVCLCVSLFG